MCVCVCVHVSMHACIYVCMHACIYVCMHACRYLYITSSAIYIAGPCTLFTGPYPFIQPVYISTYIPSYPPIYPHNVSF